MPTVQQTTHQTPQMAYLPVPNRISRKELTARIRAIIKDERNAEHLCEGNVTDVAYDLLRQYPCHRDELVALQNASTHLRSVSDDYYISMNAFYREQTSHINKTIVQPILRQIQRVTHFDVLLAKGKGENAWCRHCDLLFFDTKEQCLLAMEALKEHLIFDEAYENLLDHGRGFAVFYELREWKKLYRQHQEEFAKTIVD